MNKLTMLLTSPQTPGWVHKAAIAAMREEPFRAMNSTTFLAIAVREWALRKLKEAHHG